MLLSEPELRAALEPLLDRLLSERLRLFQLQLEPRLQSLIAAALEPRAAARMQEGLRRVLESRDPNHCFEEVFEQAGDVVGTARALIAVRQGEAAVWRSRGLALPARFPLAHRDLTLRGGPSLPIHVRGRLVGLLHWSGAALEAAAQARLNLLLQAAGMTLLAQALPAPAVAAAPAPAETAARAAARPPAPSLPASEAEARAQRFALLLIEDLALYLRRERSDELAAARQQGDWARRFQPEIERCRRAFRDRYPVESGADLHWLEEALPRLAAP